MGVGDLQMICPMREKQFRLNGRCVLFFSCIETVDTRSALVPWGGIGHSLVNILRGKTSYNLGHFQAEA